jgi:hypothetical protein
VKNRILVAASLVLIAAIASAQTLKWDLKPMPDGFSVPANQLRVHEGMLIPQISMVWVNPNDQNNFEVMVIPRFLYRKANGPLCPVPGYEWVDPDNLQNFDVRPVQATVPSSADDAAAVSNSSDEDESHSQSVSQTTPADSSQELPPCISVQPTGVQILNPKYVPCKSSDVPPAASGDQSGVSQQVGAPASPGHEHEPNPPASGSPGTDRSPAFIPLGGAAAPVIGQELERLNGVIEQRDADMDYIQNGGKSSGNNSVSNGGANNGNGGANSGGSNGASNGDNGEANGGGNGEANGGGNGGGNGGSEASSGGGEHGHEGGTGDSMK